VEADVRRRRCHRPASLCYGLPNTIDTLSYPDPPRRETCTLRAFVDGAGNVTSTDWQGSNAGCYDAQQKLAGKVNADVVYVAADYFSLTDSTAHAASAKKRTWSARSPVKRP
jgi:hypothetical protein